MLIDRVKFNARALLFMVIFVLFYKKIAPQSTAHPHTGGAI